MTIGIEMHVTGLEQDAGDVALDARVFGGDDIEVHAIEADTGHFDPADIVDALYGNGNASSPLLKRTYSGRTPISSLVPGGISR